MEVFRSSYRVLWKHGIRPKHRIGFKAIKTSSVLFVFLMQTTSFSEPSTSESAWSGSSYRVEFLNTVDLQTLQESRLPTDFLVSDEAFTTMSLVAAGGIWFVESESFSNWLSRNGDFGLLVALNDKRPIPSEVEEFPLDNDGGRGEVETPELQIEEMRVCDMAYQLSCSTYRLSRMSYRDNCEKRQILIAKLVAKLNRGESEPEGKTGPKESE